MTNPATPASIELAPLELPDADLVVDHEILSTRYFELSSVRTIAIAYATAHGNRVRDALMVQMEAMRKTADTYQDAYHEARAALTRPADTESPQ